MTQRICWGGEILVLLGVERLNKNKTKYLWYRLDGQPTFLSMFIQIPQIFLFVVISKTAVWAVFDLFFFNKRLTFAELGRTTSLVETVVFTFYNTAIACQEASRL